jgi:FKBP-type peptidyl-prolyl cis-trans isomerase FklB
MSASSKRLAALAALLLACGAEPRGRSPQTDEERTSYALGLHLGRRLARLRIDVDPGQFVAGFAAAFSSGLEVDADGIRTEIERLLETARGPAERARAQARERNSRAAEEFFAANRSRPGVVEIASGVQYRILEAGEGTPPALEDRVTVDYEGRLLDGAVFDTSRDRSAPTILRLRRTPRAWQEVVPRLGGGGRVEIWVPGDRAADGFLGLVDPGEAVAFEIQLLAIDRSPSARAPRASPDVTYGKDPTS